MKDKLFYTLYMVLLVALSIFCGWLISPHNWMLWVSTSLFIAFGWFLVLAILTGLDSIIKKIKENKKIIRQKKYLDSLVDGKTSVERAIYIANKEKKNALDEIELERNSLQRRIAYAQEELKALDENYKTLN